LEGAAVVLGVDDEHPGRADGQVVEVGLAAGDLEVMQDPVAVAFQALERRAVARSPRAPSRQARVGWET
jgi:hypothetical protein